LISPFSGNVPEGDLVLSLIRQVRKITSEIPFAERLEDLKALPDADFLTDQHRVGSAKYNLIIAGI
jgi:hypothetical protein